MCFTFQSIFHFHKTFECIFFPILVYDVAFSVAAAVSPSSKGNKFIKLKHAEGVNNSQIVVPMNSWLKFARIFFPNVWLSRRFSECILYCLYFLLLLKNGIDSAWIYSFTFCIAFIPFWIELTPFCPNAFRLITKGLDWLQLVSNSNLTKSDTLKCEQLPWVIQYKSGRKWNGFEWLRLVPIFRIGHNFAYACH